MKIRVFLADDHAIVRHGLRMMLESEGDMEIVGEAADGREAVRTVSELQPDVVILDITMPGLDGLTAMAQIREHCPKTRILVLTMHASGEHISRALRGGARGYLLKESAGANVPEAVRAVRYGREYLDPVVARVVAERDILFRQSDRSPVESLSEREREILPLVAEGHSSTTIGERLFLSPKTVDTYRSRLMRKLGVGNMTELVKFAVEHGLTTPS